jgi:hypothetical protein
MLGEPTFQDEEHRVPYEGGGTGKPPITFNLTGGGSYGRDENIQDMGQTIPGLNQQKYNYNLNLGAEMKLPWNLTATGNVGIGRSSTKTDYKGQPVDWLSGVGETKLGDQWNVGLKWSKKFNEGGRVPYSKGSSSEVLPADFDELDPDELMHIIKLLKAGEIPEYASGGRIGFKNGKGPKMSRRNFLKIMGGLAALPVVGKFFKFAKPGAKALDLTQVPIQNADGMPSWFKPLVNRVIKEGVETTKLAPNKGGAYLDRQIVHSAKLGEGQRVRVYQNLDDQTINVEYQSADNMGGVDDGIVNLEYTAPQVIEPPIIQGGKLSGYGKGVKTKAEFEAHEAYPLQDSKDYKTITFESDNTVKNVDDLFSDTSALKQFGTNKTLSKKELEIAKQKRKRVKEINEDPSEELAGSGPDYDPYEDFASGGRVPLGTGKLVKGLGELAKKLAKEKARTQRISGNLRLENMQRTKIGKPKLSEDEYNYYRELLDDEENYFVMGDETKEMLEAMVKEADAEMNYMYRLYKKGALDPTPGEQTRGRLKMLENKAQSGVDMTTEEIKELKILSDMRDRLASGGIARMLGE